MQPIGAAILTLKNQIGESWPHLVGHLDDPEFAVTISGEYSSSNYSVGRLCDLLLQESLMAPAWLVIGSEEDYRAWHAREFLRARGNDDQGRSWLQHAKDERRAFADMQIEYIRWIIGELTKAKAHAQLQQS
ncbi:MAG: hypothetical protein QM811_25260 [Pirellulales bacterium]